MHYYSFNIGDYARDTGHLTVLEHGIYHLLMDWCYLNEKPLTTEQAIRVSRGNPEETQSVLSEFFKQDSDGWRHKRIDSEIAKYHAKALQNKENGSKGGRPKPKNNPVGSQVVAKNNPNPNPNQEPITNNQEPYIEESANASSAADAAVQSAGKQVSVKALVAEGVDKQIASDWMILRKAKRLPLTATAWDNTKQEGEKVGLSPAETVAHAVKSNWAGFRSIWYLKDVVEPVASQSNGSYV